MITVRQRRGGLTAENSSPAVSPDSNKRQRTQEADEVTPAPTRKRQKKLPVRKKEEENVRQHTYIAVEIPVRDITQDSTVMWTAPDQGESIAKKAGPDDKPSSNSEVRDKGQNSGGAEDGQPPSPVAPGIVEEDIAVATSSEKPLKKTRNGKKVNNKAQRKLISTSKAIQLDGSSVPQPQHKRFGSEEPAVAEFEVRHKGETGEEGEFSDDDAPDVVATHDAKENIRMAAHSATKAIEEQNSLLRQKRKERDAQLKEQAKAASKKGRPGVDAEESHVTSGPLDTTDITNENNHKDDLNPIKSEAIISKSNLPDFLPMEYLEDDPAENHSSPPPLNQAASHKPKKIKFFDRPSKKLKDRKVGSVTYRVAEAHGNSLLAPKAVNHARSVKEQWLSGQRGAAGVSRKVMNAGFFKKKAQNGIY